MKRLDFRAFVKEFGAANLVFVMPCRPVHSFLPLLVSFESSDDEERINVPFQLAVEESQYKDLAYLGKVPFVPMVKGYGTQRIYGSDLMHNLYHWPNLYKVGYYDADQYFTVINFEDEYEKRIHLD